MTASTQLINYKLDKNTREMMYCDVLMDKDDSVSILKDVIKCPECKEFCIKEESHKRELTLKKELNEVTENFVTATKKNEEIIEGSIEEEKNEDNIHRKTNL